MTIPILPLEGQWFEVGAARVVALTLWQMLDMDRQRRVVKTFGVCLNHINGLPSAKR
jgi:hypothetical protein